jgi:hypothetical protein
LAAEIARWQDRVIDADLAVDAARTDLERAVAGLQDAVRDRDRAVRHLQRLIGWHGKAA